MPNKASVLGTAARLIAISAVVGLLLPPPEAADAKKRLKGAEGIKACDEALVGPKAATDPGRRVELMLARGIHKIEVKDYAGAMADAHLPETDQPALVALPAYKLSLGLSALELEALALVGMGKVDEAADKALAMVSAAPYDIVNIRRARKFVGLPGRYGASESSFFEQAVRVEPANLLMRSDIRQIAGDFAGAAADLDAWRRLIASIPDSEDVQFPSANAGLAFALAGNRARADELIAAAAKTNDTKIAAGKTEGVTSTSEVLDFYDIWKMAADGKQAQARALFAGRSRWASVSTGAQVELAKLLRRDAKPNELIGQLAIDPAEMRARALAIRAKVVNDGGEDGAEHYKLVRDQIDSAQFAGFAANVWKADNSKYFVKNNPGAEKLHARLITTSRNGTGMPAAFAMYLHAALVSKAQGKSGFMVLPIHHAVFASLIRLGNPADGDIVAPVSFDADKVIADLSPLIPRPVTR